MKIYNAIEFSDLEAIINNATGIANVHTESNNILFQFKDKDQDIVGALVYEVDRERLIVALPIPIPDEYQIGSLIAANNWNQQKDAHDTFSYLASIDDKPKIMLESHLLLRGGISDKNIEAWINNFIEHINSFEEIVSSTLASVNKDSELLRQNKSFFESIGEFVGSAIRGYQTASQYLNESTGNYQQQSSSYPEHLADFAPSQRQPISQDFQDFLNKTGNGQ
ncbi:MAG: YbjN domain-containing protein [Waterburya sp.]